MQRGIEDGIRPLGGRMRDCEADEEEMSRLEGITSQLYIFEREARKVRQVPTLYSRSATVALGAG